MEKPLIDLKSALKSKTTKENRQKSVFIVIAVGLFFTIYFLPTPEGLSQAGLSALAVFAFTVTLWITRPISFPMIFFFTAVLFVGTSVLTPQDAFHGAGSSTIFFLLGAIILAFSLSKYGLDKRIALKFLNRFGSNPSMFLFGIVLISSFLSMIMPAHAVVALLIPIILSIFRASKKEMMGTNFSKAILLAIAYSSSIGSMGTLLGGARNPLAISIFYQTTGETVNFLDWFIAAIPIVCVMTIFIYIIIRVFYPLENFDMSSLQTYLQQEVKKMGKISFDELKVLFFLILAFILWVVFGTIIGMATVAVFIAGLLGVSNTLNWKDVENKLPWGIIFLYAGAITLSFSLTDTGASSFIAQSLIDFVSANIFLTILAVVTLTIFLSEIMSNSAATGTLLPITLTIFTGLGFSAVTGMYVVALPSAFALMFIIGTPGSAMVYDTGFLKIKDFVKPGLTLNILGIIIFMTLGLGWWKIIGLW
ncbi:MAG: DASS family sodium-coupled anion symporter [Candidatus Thermoplasmatota archaeon]|nr:DASS family sodium-coupled anion symporter [Candidatus Thermoplasmatota archaeon]